ncbi:TetR family transcriptional regulator [Shewanella woodyi]|uniref:TetR family transcriptional regulator n=1 Tax=Shewanella woodyi TaxID=60961 RepID=UPI0007F8E930|nr:TetR family transcriptional regulator [Shewanella woodyi]
MAKRSKAETEQTINLIMDEALKQLLSLGYDSMSYTTLSTATGISRTGISHHFPHKANFLIRLDPQISRLFLDELDFSNLGTLEESWIESIKHPTGRMVLKLFFSLCGDHSEDVTQFKAVHFARERAYEMFGLEGEKLVTGLIGRSAVMLMSQSTNIKEPQLQSNELKTRSRGSTESRLAILSEY